MTTQEERPKADAPEGRYANYFEVGHNAFEFVIHLGQCYPDGGSGSEKVQLHTRIVTTPVYAKALLETLRKSIDEYEKSLREGML